MFNISKNFKNTILQESEENYSLTKTSKNNTEEFCEEEFEKENKKDLERLNQFLNEKPEMKDWIGKDFECVIRRKGIVEFGDDFEISNDKWIEVLTPKLFSCEIEERGDWTYYKIDKDEFTFDFEPVGILIFFNDEIKYPKAEKILNELKDNIEKSTKQEVEILINCKHDHRYKLI
ncbi:hypothetical protein [Aureivirga sp. CE67]|uniref:hypothetical protein n=1 Tax=Aureivirga sp. CE67 TaxID=1788983 RepID=UPI0018CAD1BF|nr:hypothetical protein [Aureivirga sp. CE67]